jgi:hypothetical protein
MCIAQFPFRIKNLTTDFGITQLHDSSPCFQICDVFRRIGARHGHWVAKNPQFRRCETAIIGQVSSVQEAEEMNQMAG